MIVQVHHATMDIVCMIIITITVIVIIITIPNSLSAMMVFSAMESIVVILTETAYHDQFLALEILASTVTKPLTIV